mgnify:CR=1 FL=1
MHDFGRHNEWCQVNDGLKFPNDMHVVLGEKDNVISGSKTLDYLKDHIKDKYMKFNVHHIKKMGHRVPLDVFIDIYNKTIK